MSATPDKKLPLRCHEQGGELKPTTPRLDPPFTGSKPFDSVEKKLSLALDALLDAIQAYREAKQ